MTKKKEIITGHRKLWQFPWKYKESFLIALFALILGFLLQLITGGGVNMPQWPMNIAIILIFILYFVLIHFLVKHPIVKWLSSIPAAIAAVSTYTLMVLFMGFIPQFPNWDDPSLFDILGFTSVTSSWAYLMVALYLLIVLGFTIMRRLNKFSIKNIAFLLNHIGLWIVVVAASLGATDMWRLSMQVDPSGKQNIAVDSKRLAWKMDFAMQLIDFHIEEHPPEVGLMRTKDYTLKLEKGGRLATVTEGETDILEGYTLSFEKYIPYARKYEETWDTSSYPGAARAVYIKVTDDQGSEVAEGWVADGSTNFGIPSSFLVLNDSISIAMMQFSPKKYNSDIRMFSPNGDYEDFHIEVNKPVKINGWKVYQTGYDEEMGRWSNVSVIELVRDPWLPVVYVGIFMILFGTLYLVWMGKGRTKTKKA